MHSECASSDAACGTLLNDFFARHHDKALRENANTTLRLLLKHSANFQGEPGGWAGGIVYAVGCVAGAGVPGVTSADLEQAFGTTMGTIRKRAEQIKELIGLNAEVAAERTVLTVRDEANAICALAFRNGPIEKIHGEHRISDPEMREIMINASAMLAELMEMERRAPDKYEEVVRHYHKYCAKWER